MEKEITEVTREDLPLKSNKKTSTCEEYLGGSKFINVAFGSLSIVITAALLVQIYYGDYQVVPHGSVATDCLECSEIGTTILKKGGNAIDAAIASAFCLSIFAPHTTGLDADGQLLLYNHKTRTSAKLVDFSDLSISTDLPRLVLGLAYCHRMYGTISWKELIEPSIKFARDGFLVSKVLVQAIQVMHVEDLFGRLEPSQFLKSEKLADTMQSVSDLQEKQLESFITPENRPVETEAYKFKFKNYDIYVPNVPSIGPVLSLLMQQIEKSNFTSEDIKNTKYYKILAEVTQIIYKDFQLGFRFHEGASTNIAVVDKNENYVSLVTGLTSLFGSHEMTSSGYIMNDKPKGLRYSNLPIIVVDSEFICGRRIVLGANNIALAAQVLSSLLIGQQNVTESIEGPRFHMKPDGTIGFENSHYPYLPDEVEKILEALSSTVFNSTEPYDSINIVEKRADFLSSHSDSRGGGIASRFR